MIITCNTPIENLININAIEELANEYQSTIKTEINELIATITMEQKKGLSPDSFNIDNDSMIYEKSERILTDLAKLSSNVSNWKKEIIKKAEEKRQEELNQLKTAVYEKLVNLSEEISKLSVKSLMNNNAEIVSQKETLKNLYHKYKTKYDQLLTLKE